MQQLQMELILQSLYNFNCLIKAWIKVKGFSKIKSWPEEVSFLDVIFIEKG